MPKVTPVSGDSDFHLVVFSLPQRREYFRFACRSLDSQAPLIVVKLHRPVHELDNSESLP